MEEKTIFEQIMDALLSHNIAVFPPSTKEGECTQEYVVVKYEGGTTRVGFSSQIHYYSVLLYVPRDECTRLEKFKKEIKEIIATDLYPMLMPSGQETQHFYDDGVKGHMASVQYRLNVRNKQL